MIKEKELLNRMAYTKYRYERLCVLFDLLVESRDTKLLTSDGKILSNKDAIQYLLDERIKEIHK